MKYIPNLITAANLACGFYALTALLQGQPVAAAWAIVWGGVFDLFDGRLARRWGVSSEFGGAFDTLSDFLTFGVAPAALLHAWALRPLGQAGWALACAYALAVAFRLARFSVGAGSARKGFFQGLSSPPAAATVASLALFAERLAWQPQQKLIGAATAVIALPLLMVSSMRFPSFKETDWRSPRGLAILAIATAGVLAVICCPSLALFPIGVAFIGVSLILNVLPARG